MFRETTGRSIEAAFDRKFECLSDVDLEFLDEVSIVQQVTQACLISFVICHQWRAAGIGGFRGIQITRTGH